VVVSRNTTLCSGEARVHIRNPKDFWSGLLFLMIGAWAMLLAHRYQFGSTFKMGPGYFPTVLGGMLALVGLAAMVRSLVRPGTSIEALSLRNLALILGATLLFGVLIRGAGLIVAVVAIVVVGDYASVRFRWKPTAMLAAGLAAFSALVFVQALGLPIRLVGPWLGG
jgi:putative tricarboxylic transport membrane protein